jgi:hypothetical protein
MPSPFPGMDASIEGQRWREFHFSLIVAISHELVAQLRPRYVMNIEEYVYFNHEERNERGVVLLGLPTGEMEECWPSRDASTAPAVYIEPTSHTVPLPEQIEKTYLEISKCGIHSTRDGGRVK